MSFQVNRVKIGQFFYSGFLFVFLYSQAIFALEKISFSIDDIIAKGWRLEGVTLSLLNLHGQRQKFSSLIKQLSLPKPFSDIRVVDIQCLSFTWNSNKIACQKGEASLATELISSSSFAFDFSITEKKSNFSLQNIQFADGSLSLYVTQGMGRWNATIQSHNLQLQTLYSLFKQDDFFVDEVSHGVVDAFIQIEGKGEAINNVLAKTEFKKVTLQASKGQIAAELLDSKLNLQATQTKGQWKWTGDTQILQGELYLEPVYLDIKGDEVKVFANGIWSEQQSLIIQQVKMNHSAMFDLTVDGDIKQAAGFIPDSASIFLNIINLEGFSTHYISPFIEQTELEGIKLQGQLEAEIKVVQSKIKGVTGHLKDVSVTDDKQRIAVKNVEGLVNWSANIDFLTPSYFQWDQLKIKAIPIEAGRFDFLTKNKQIDLLKPSLISLLGGSLNIQKFNWQQTEADEPKLFFQGGVKDISLERLSQALGWTPLTGTISGNIPGVDYENKTLTVHGGLNVDIFEGVIKINKLASSGLFTNFSKFYMDMEIENLNLHAITQKFKMGGIEGRLSGSINNLYLENWKPVTFYAWFGTPKDDKSRHRISQKAVENIASIGGGGAADAISKGFLRFFDTFWYKRLGFGCYLYQGVCQIMGVEATKQGYYLIEGGGIPRIDIIGYNTAVDWNVLIERLSRIADTDNVVIE